MARNRTAVALQFIALLVIACDGNGGSPDAGQPAASAPAPDRTGSRGFEAAADQFGLERFSITTETYRAPVKVGLRTRRESSATVTRYVENYGERVAMETRSEKRHEQYYWDGRRGILHDVVTGTTTDQGAVRLRTSEPEQRAVASASQLASWGYERAGEKTVLDRPCEVWASPEQRTEFCRWRHLVLESLDFDTDGNETGRMTAIEIREGEGIPAEFAALGERL